MEKPNLSRKLTKQVLRELILLKRFTVHDLSRFLNIGEKDCAGFVIGRAEMTFRQAKALASSLGMSIAELIWSTVKPPPIQRLRDRRLYQMMSDLLALFKKFPRE